MTDLESPKKNNDCYFYYYSTCVKVTINIVLGNDQETAAMPILIKCGIHRPYIWYFGVRDSKLKIPETDNYFHKLTHAWLWLNF